MDKISLNFLELLNQDFVFKVYIKLYDQEKLVEDNLYVYSLIETEGEKYKKFYVSFSSKEDYKEFICKPYYNKDLTKRYYFELFKKKISANPNGLNYMIENDPFTYSISFIIKKLSRGLQTIVITPYYLAIENKFGFLIDFKFKLNTGIKLDKEALTQSLSLDKNGNSNKNFYSDKYSFIKTFINNYHTILFPIFFDSETINASTKLFDLPYSLLEKKKYIFKNGKPAFSQFQGIKSYGPFKPILDEVMYIFVFEDSFKSFGNELYLSLSGKLNPGTFPGMSQMFELPINQNQVTRLSIEHKTLNELLEIVEKIKKIKSNNLGKKIIVVYLEGSNQDTDINNSPYYILKYKLLQEDIPMQTASYNKVGDKNSMKWSTSNIGLQIFSKVGGIPWIVSPSNNNCLILGIGSAHKKNEDGFIRKYFAYSICLDSSGLYKKLIVLSESNEKERYLKELKQKLIALFSDTAFSGYKKCVLHIPFKIKKYEMDSISDALKEIKQVEFKVIKINDKNKFFGFSNHNTYVPYESSYIKLSKNEYLVWFEGLSYGKEIVYQQVGNPVHIQFVNFETTSKTDDLLYLQDVLNLSGANWRGFNAKSIPISIYYSQLVARYTKAFENFDDFNQEIFSSDKPWFL